MVPDRPVQDSIESGRALIVKVFNVSTFHLIPDRELPGRSDNGQPRCGVFGQKATGSVLRHLLRRAALLNTPLTG